MCIRSIVIENSERNRTRWKIGWGSWWSQRFPLAKVVEIISQKYSFLRFVERKATFRASERIGSRSNENVFTHTRWWHWFITGIIILVDHGEIIVGFRWWTGEKRFCFRFVSILQVFRCCCCRRCCRHWWENEESNRLEKTSFDRRLLGGIASVWSWEGGGDPPLCSSRWSSSSPWMLLERLVSGVRISSSSSRSISDRK